MWVLIKLALLVHKCEGFWIWVWFWQRIRVLLVSLFEFILISRTNIVQSLFPATLYFFHVEWKMPARIEVERDIHLWMGVLVYVVWFCVSVPSIALKWGIGV